MTSKTSNNPHGFEVGQKVFTIGSGRSGVHHEPKHREISKIGRKWVETKCGHRFDIETCVADGGKYSPPFKVFMSEQHYAETEGLKVEWLSFKNSLAYSPPKGMTVEKLAKIKELVFGGDS